MFGELSSVLLLTFAIPNDWFTVVTEPLKSVSRRRAINAVFAVRPGKALPSSPFTGNDAAAPNVANGVKPGSPNPFDFVFRNSNPPLNACLPCVQLRSSPMEYIGLTWDRQRPNPPY